MADYVLSAKGTYDGKDFDSGVNASGAKLEAFMGKAQSLGSKISGMVGGAVKTAGKAVVGTVAAAGAAVTTLAATGGVARALNIEQAQHKLRQMGMDVESIMASCNDAVGGTKFGLDAAATSASLLGTSGVQAGEQMTQALKAAAGVATIAGTGMEDVSSIFSKVASKGKLTGDELLQLNERGVNATDALAKSLNKTTAEVQRMVSRGEVDFQTFSDAMYSCFGEAASGANETFQGAMSNVRAALSRTGAKFASPALDSLRKVFVATIPAVNALSSALDPAVAAFSELAEGFSGRLAAGIEEFTLRLTEAGSFLAGFTGGLRAAFEGTGAGGFFESVDAAAGAFLETIRDGGTKIEGLRNALSSLGGCVSSIFGGMGGGLVVFMAAFVGVMSKLRDPIGAVVSAIGGIGSTMADIGSKVAGLGSAFATAGGGVKGLVAVLGALVSPVGLIVAAVAALAAGFVYLMATSEGFRTSVTGLVEQIGAALAPAVESIVAAVGGLAASALPAITSIISMLLPLIGQIVTVILQVVAALAPVVSTIVSALAPALAMIISLIANVANIVLTAVMPVIAAILGAVLSAMPVIQQVVTDVLGVVGSVFQGVWNAIQIVVTTVVGAIQSLISIALAAINGDWQGVWNGICSFFAGIWEGLLASAKNGVDTVVNVVTGIKDTVLNFFSGAGQWLCSAGASIVQGLIDGITGMIGAAGDAIGGVMAAISNFLPHSPAKEGAFSGKGWSLYSGRAITSGLASGIGDGADGAVSAMSSVVGSVAGILSASPVLAVERSAEFEPVTFAATSPATVAGGLSISKADVYDAMVAALESSGANEPAQVYLGEREVTNALAPHLGARLGQIERRRANGL